MARSPYSLLSGFSIRVGRFVSGQPRALRQRFNSTSTKGQVGVANKWTTGKSLLFASFASTLAYSYGSLEQATQIGYFRGKGILPQYGNTKALEQVCLIFNNMSKPDEL
jgi:hypothetical protein